MSVLSVSQLAAEIKAVVEGSFGLVQVQGELVGKVAASGHFYGDLRDESALISCVAWRGMIENGLTIPPPGTLVVMTGELTTYPMRSSYQLKILKIEPAGQGALLQRIEATRKMLAEEGLLDAARKKPLPFLPRRLGIITSSKGAVIQDILHRLEARTPVPVMLWPVAVQGPTAEAEIITALRGMAALPEDQRPDVVIVARGGGSFEDLLAFNTEGVARAVAACPLPVISGVGHEPDMTLCDMAADVRAPTPTAAAEMAVPVRRDLLSHLNATGEMMARRLSQTLTEHARHLASLSRMLPQPERLLLQATQRVDDAQERLVVAGERLLITPTAKLEALARLLASLNPEAPLARGFALVTAPDGTLVTSAATPATDVTLRFKDGVRGARLD
ncbi:MAG: exodeoxyribonuclease VII large subunit [Alphaproteobacteria bacterium CG_4_10_14_0_8_um_filter_53_9]|nr:MAG: exodeoxyribonuclease VII large subunit [Alphaproteobacteria bacterium CG_4_10_14_0_8_um_filter_53_9]